MKIIKRNGAEEVFDIKKIVIAVTKADSSSEGRSLTDSQIEDIAEFVEFKCNKLNRAVSVEEIQDLVEDQIMATGAFELAKRYVRYRYKRSLVRKANTTDNRILSLIECNNEDVKQENSNKNPAVNMQYRGIIWQERSASDLTQTNAVCRKILSKRIKRVSSIFMIRIIMRSICITVILSIWKICSRTERSSAEQ